MTYHMQLPPSTSVDSGRISYVHRHALAMDSPDREHTYVLSNFRWPAGQVHASTCTLMLVCRLCICHTLCHVLMTHHVRMMPNVCSCEVVTYSSPCVIHYLPG